jgi:plasmid segregation protein ParM
MGSSDNKYHRQQIFAGVDDGYAETKIALSNGIVIKIPSQAKAGEMNQISINGSRTSTYSYTTEDGNFIIGDIREADTTAFDDYPHSAMNRVIVTHALRKAGLSGDVDLFICSGLPIKKFYSNGKTNQEQVNKKRANLLKADVFAADGYSLARIVKHDVISEGIAAWMDLVLFRNEQTGRLGFNPEMVNQRIAIVDIGGRTTDIAVIEKGALDISRSSTINVGMLAVRDAVVSAIHDTFDVTATVEQMNQAIETKQIKLWGEFHDVSQIVDNAEKSTATRIETEVKKCLGNASDLDKIVFVGGAVVELERYLTGWFRQQQIGLDPAFANARGMQKYSEMMTTAK